MPWCKFFIPKIASPHIKPGDPELNEHIMYAKCIKGHVLVDANDWILCENLPSPDARCWQEGGETLFTLMTRKRREQADDTMKEPESKRREQADDTMKEPESKSEPTRTIP